MSRYKNPTETSRASTSLTNSTSTIPGPIGGAEQFTSVHFDEPRRLQADKRKMDESSKILHPTDAEHSSLLCVSYVLDADLFDRASIGIAASATTARTRDARAGLAI
jgi:hypothetical protein